jgi:gamma-tubulin complex component 3
VSDLTLRKLVVWVQDPLDKLRLIARLIDSVDGLRGGALASAIHSFVLHGDPAVRHYVQTVMKAVAAPIFRMIRRWVFEGELDDTHVRSFSQRSVVEESYITLPCVARVLRCRGRECLR